MEYRSLGKGGERVSTISIGGSRLHTVPDKELERMIDFAQEIGFNSIDLATETMDVFPKMSTALKGRREKFILGLHLGLTFQNDGQYKRTRNIHEVENGFYRQLRALETDYADIGYIHYVDDDNDYRNVFESGTYDFALKLKREGRIRNLGFASHQASICRRFIEDAEFDLFMFSINPAYDIDPVANNPLDEDLHSFDTITVARERSELYRLAEKKGVGIMVMKPLGAGRLLDERTSPFGRAMTVPQCIQYCMDRPAVCSCLVGADSTDQLASLARYFETGREERDYSFIAGIQFEEMLGKCVYCGHCLPCPSTIDIASVNKFLDLALSGDELARQHYMNLNHKAGKCIQCGSCETNCPFRVPVREKMREAAVYFGI